MKIYIPLFLLIILTISFSSCAKKSSSDSTTTSTSTDPAAITGESMTIGIIDYTSSLLSSCQDMSMTSTAGDSVYAKQQLFVYDNKTLIKDTYFYSNSSCTTSLSSFTNASDNTAYTNPRKLSYDNASFVSVSSSQTITGTVFDKSGTEIDNSTYVLLIYNCYDGAGIQGVQPVYPKSTSELQIGRSGTFCYTQRYFNITDNITLNISYTPQ